MPDSDGFDLPEDELQEEFIRPAAGPGGQHVNKTSNGVRIRWNFEETSVLTEAQKRRFRKIAAPFLCDGEAILTEHGERSLTRNREVVRERLAALCRASLVAPRPRIPTKPTKASKERRLQAKNRRGKLKSERSGHWD